MNPSLEIQPDTLPLSPNQSSHPTQEFIRRPPHQVTYHHNKSPHEVKMLITVHSRHLSAYLLFSRTERRLDRRSEYGLVRTTIFLNTHRRTPPAIVGTRRTQSHGTNTNKPSQTIFKNLEK